MNPLAIFEEQVKTDENGQVHDIRGWVGPEEGVTVAQRNADGYKTGVSTVEYQRYAEYYIQITNGRLSFWRIEFKDSGYVTVYEKKRDNEWPALELEGYGATGILRVAQIVNAVMSLAVSYCDKRLEEQKS